MPHYFFRLMVGTIATEEMTLSTMTTTMTMKMRMRILTPRPKSPTRYAESFTKLQSKAIFRLNFLKVIIISGVYFEINYWL